MAIRLTQQAIEHCKTLLTEQSLSENYGLRVALDESAPDGVGLSLEEGPEENDRAVTLSGVQIFCNRRSYLMMGDIEVDFSSDAEGFKVKVVG
jgi:Fe-S cluster assembly iron-binding protein IscA